MMVHSLSTLFQCHAYTLLIKQLATAGDPEYHRSLIVFRFHGIEKKNAKYQFYFEMNPDETIKTYQKCRIFKSPCP